MGRFSAVASGLFLSLAGCGDDGGNSSLPDAPTGTDSAVEIDAAPSGNVTVTTLTRCCDDSPNTPQAGVTVIALQSDGSLAGTATSDALGKATISNVRAGATVTARYPEQNGDTDVTTYAGVQPGDALTFGETFTAPITAGVNGTQSIRWPFLSGAAYYYLYTSCTPEQYAGSNTAGSAAFYDSCQAATGPALVAAYNQSNELIGTLYAPSIAFVSGSAVMLTQPWVTQTGMSNFVVDLLGLDSTFRSSYVNVSSSFAGGLAVRTQQSLFEPQAGVASHSFTVPTTAQATVVSAQVGRIGSPGYQYHFKTGSTSPVQLPASTLPWINGVIVSPDDRKAVWLQGAGTYDAAVLHIGWNRSDGGKGRSFYNWNIILPPTVTSFDLGTPPTALAEVLPTATDDLDYELQLVDLSSAASYDAIRALPEWRVADVEASVRAGVETTASISSSEGEGVSFGFATDESPAATKPAHVRHR